MHKASQYVHWHVPSTPQNFEDAASGQPTTSPSRHSSHTNAHRPILNHPPGQSAHHRILLLLLPNPPPRLARQWLALLSPCRRTQQILPGGKSQHITTTSSSPRPRTRHGHDRCASSASSLRGPVSSQPPSRCHGGQSCGGAWTPSPASTCPTARASRGLTRRTAR